MSRVATTVCPLDCPDLCALDVTVDNGRVTKVSAGAGTPITDGFICGKVRNIARHVHSSERIATPLIRVSGQLVPASWDQALELVVARISEARVRSGGESILGYHYSGSNGWLTESPLASRLFRRLGATRLDRTFCSAPSSAASLGMYGPVPGVALEDYQHTQLALLWGVNPSVSGIHFVPIIEQLLDRGGELIVVDPRATPLARRAHLHLAPNVGTDVVLALATINVLFERGLADQNFLRDHATGVEELQARAAKWPLGTASEVTGIVAARIEELAVRFAAASPAAVRSGWGYERTRNGGGAVAAVLALPAVAGKFGVRGGGFTLSNGAGWGVSRDATIYEPASETRTLNMSRLGRALDGPERLTDPPLEVVFIYNCNPASTAPSQQAVRRGLARDDVFTVVHDAVMTDTAALADVVLPATTFLEHRDIKRGYGSQRLYDAPAVMPPVGEARSNNQLFAELLTRLNLTRPSEPITDDELAAGIFAGERGAELQQQLAEYGVANPRGHNQPAAVLMLDVFPATSDGKIHLIPADLDDEAPGGLYHFRPAANSPDYPLALISPAQAHTISSTFGQLRTAEAFVELSPADARARGITDGDEVRLWNAAGEVLCVARVSAHVRDGVVVMPKGLWARHTRNGATTNTLIADDESDLARGACFNDARVECGKTAR